MVAKSEIIDELGQSDLLLPERIAESLTANDRAKYFFALLQMARANAERPIVPAPDLKTERLESRVEDSWLDDVVAAARVDGQTDLVLPRGREILEAAGATDVFPELSRHKSAKDRIVSPEAVIAVAPDIIIGSWCGKKFVPARVAARPGFTEIPAVKSGLMREIKSTVILQPGPAALTDGLDQVVAIVEAWARQTSA